MAPIDVLALIIIVGTASFVVAFLCKVWYEVIGDYRIHAINLMETIIVSLILIFVIAFISCGTLTWITQLSQTYNWL